MLSRVTPDMYALRGRYLNELERGRQTYTLSDGTFLAEQYTGFCRFTFQRYLTELQAMSDLAPQDLIDFLVRG